MSLLDNQESGKTDLLEYFFVAWKYRWWIVGPTLAAAVLAGVIGFFLPKIWKVEAIIVPSKFLTQSENGEFRVVNVASAKEVASQVGEGAYNAVVEEELGIPPHDFPRIQADALRETNLVRVSVRGRNPEKNRLILLSLFAHLKDELDRKINVEVNALDTQVENAQTKIDNFKIEIENQEIEKTGCLNDIKVAKNKLVINEQRINGLLQDMETTKIRMAEMETLRKKTIEENKDSTQSLSLLIYANEIQGNIQYINFLDERLREARITAEDLKALINKNERDLLLTDNNIMEKRLAIDGQNTAIKMIQDRKNRIDYATLVKKPTVSRGPVSPRKLMIVVIGGLIGFCLSLGIAFFKETLELRRKEDRSAA